MAAYTSFACPAKCSIENSSIPRSFNKCFKTSLSSIPLIGKSQPFHRIASLADVSRTVKEASVKILDSFVDSVFRFSDQTLLPSERKFAPVDEIKEPVHISCIEGEIPDNFPEGIYIRNGPNPLFGGNKSTVSLFGRSSHSWIEGEGMLHAIYFDRNSVDGTWNVVYNNKEYVETETYKLEKLRNRPSFLPALEGDSLAILASYLLNFLRFGITMKHYGNTNIFVHAGKLYAIAENHMPQEIDMSTLESLGVWDVNGAWNRPFTSHPKKVPGTGELLIFGVDAVKPFLEVGVISADGELVHKVDLKLDRCSLCHEIGVTERYNVVMDMALTIDLRRLIGGGPLMKYDKGGYARVSVMPRYGDENSIKWFEVESNCTFHILNCFEDGDEVVMWGCRALASIIPGPDRGVNRSEWFSKGFKPAHSIDENGNKFEEDECFFSRPHEWRLNMVTGKVTEKNLVRSAFLMEFPMINEAFTGIRNKYGYTQVGIVSSISGIGRFGGLAKLYFNEKGESLGDIQSDNIKVEYHMFPENTYCNGASFVPKKHGQEEDDGWIITHVHNEITDISEVYIVDTKSFSRQPTAIITLPNRVPQGFHGAFIPYKPNH